LLEFGPLLQEQEVFMKELMGKPRLRWACRRGMLELDVLLAPFVEEGYDALTELQKHQFEALLACDDPDLFAWFMGHGKSANPELQAMVELIVNRVRV
jgi:antitoxin CptB